MRRLVSTIAGLTLLVGCNKEVDYGKKGGAQKTGPQVQTPQNIEDQGSPESDRNELESQVGNVVAILNGLPPLRNTVDKLGVTVGGEGVQEYQYAIRGNGDNCNGLQYSAWIAVDKKIEDALSVVGQHTLCVIGRTNESNPQEQPTTHTWIQDPPTAIRAQLSQTPIDGNTTPNLNVIVGGIGITEYTWALVPGADACPAAVPDAWQVVAIYITADISEPGDRKLCVKGRTANGQIQTDYTEHRWTQANQEQQQLPGASDPADPTPETVRIDLLGLNHESWNKVCLYISANNGPYSKLACNKQDNTPPKQFLEFRAGTSRCVSLNFRLEVFAFTESCLGKDPEQCATAPQPDPIRHANAQADRGFFRFLSANEINQTSLQANNIQSDLLSDSDLQTLATESTEWLQASEGRQWYRMFVEDQSDANMNRFLETGDAATTGIDFDDFVIDIRAIDVNFEVQGQGVGCPQ
jgi:hypothetical protein